MYWNWIDIAFPWIGVSVALVLLVALFCTNHLRSRQESSRWRDRVWLSWLAMAVYLLHNGEEYGIDVFGRLHAFPDALCATLKLPAYPSCPMPPAFFLGVNLPLFWFGAPLAALLNRRHPLVGLTFYGVVFTNGLMHVGPFLAGRGYSPGTLTAALLFLPLSAWVAYACFGKRGLSYTALGLLVTDGVILHVILMGSMFLFIRGMLTGRMLVTVQVLNALLFLAIPWLGEKWLSAGLVREPETGGIPGAHA